MFTVTLKFPQSVPALLNSLCKSSHKTKPTRPAADTADQSGRGPATRERSGVIRIHKRAPRVSAREIMARYRQHEAEVFFQSCSSLPSFDDSSSEFESECDDSEENELAETPPAHNAFIPQAPLPRRNHQARVSAMEVAAMFNKDPTNVKPVNIATVSRGTEVKEALSRIIASSAPAKD